MPAYNDTVDDFNLKWGNTWVLKDNQLIYIVSAFYEDTEETPPPIYVRYSIDGKNRNDYEFDFNSPKPLLFNAQLFNCIPFSDPNWNGITNKMPTCLYLTRSSRRQNKRSICSDNTGIASPFYPIISLFRNDWKPSYPVNEVYIKRIIEQEFPTYREALALCPTHLMVAISPNFAVSLSNISSDKYLFASQFGFIGEADPTTITIHHAGSLQEVRDFVKRANLDIRVINAS